MRAVVVGTLLTMAIIQPSPDFATEATLDSKLEELRSLLAGTLAVQTGDDRVVVRAVECNVGSATSVGQPVNAATQLFIGPPAGKAWRIRSLRSIYTCDSTAKDRTLVAAFTSLTVGDVWSMGAGTVAQASNVIEVSGDDDGSPGQVNSGPANGGENLLHIVNVGWPSMWIPPDITLRIWMFTGTGAADTFSDANVLVEERNL